MTFISYKFCKILCIILKIQCIFLDIVINNIKEVYIRTINV